MKTIIRSLAISQVAQFDGRLNGSKAVFSELVLSFSPLLEIESSEVDINVQSAVSLHH